MTAARASVMRERGADHAGFAMVQRGHRVEQMSEHPRAGFDRREGLLVGRVGMADRNDDPARGQSADGIQRTLEFGRERNQLEGLEAADAIERVTLRQKIQRRMYAAPRGRNERTLQMHAEDGRAGKSADCRDALACSIAACAAIASAITASTRSMVSSGEVITVGSQAVVPSCARQCASSSRSTGGRGHYVDTASAIDLQIDKAGEDVVVDLMLAAF